VASRPSRKTALSIGQGIPSPWGSADERAVNRERKRDAVILAAARAFRERGYHNTSLDDIASLLNVTKPTIYHYVTNKEQLLFECFRSGLDQIMVAFEETKARQLNGRERLIQLMSRYAQAITSEFGWCMVRAEDQDLSPEMSAQVKALKQKIDRGMRAIITEGIRDGSIRECDPKMTAFAIAGAINWVAHWYRHDDSLTHEEIAQRFIDLFDQGLKPRG
jgi:AcrR family transcriptional regulator